LQKVLIETPEIGNHKSDLEFNFRQMQNITNRDWFVASQCASVHAA
jgi:hypothetical protein